MPGGSYAFNRLFSFRKGLNNNGNKLIQSTIRGKIDSQVLQVHCLSSLRVTPDRPTVDEQFELEVCISNFYIFKSVQIIPNQVGQLVPNSRASLQISLPSATSQFLSPKLDLCVGQDGRAVLLNTMDVLSCMQGKGRFYVNGPVANNLEYNVMVEGIGEGVLKRLVYPETVRRVEVGAGEPGKVQGTLFLPEVPGPGVLCLSGAGGVRVSLR